MIKILYMVILFNLISIRANAQNNIDDILPIKDGKVNFSRVLEIEKVSQKELYNRAKTWLLNSNEYSTNLIFDDIKWDELKSKGKIKALWGPNNFPELYLTIDYKVQLNFRNNRYKYEFTSFVVKNSGEEIQLEIYKMENKKYKKYNKLFYKEINEQIQIIIDSLQKTMTINKHLSK